MVVIYWSVIENATIMTMVEGELQKQNKGIEMVKYTLIKNMVLK